MLYFMEVLTEKRKGIGLAFMLEAFFSGHLQA